MYVYHNVLTHSPADGPLDCFYVLAFVNSATMNIGVHVFFFICPFQFWFLQDVYPVVGWRRHIYTYGRFTLMYGENPHKIVVILQLK